MSKSAAWARCIVASENVRIFANGSTEAMQQGDAAIDPDHRIAFRDLQPKPNLFCLQILQNCGIGAQGIARIRRKHALLETLSGLRARGLRTARWSAR